MPDTGGRGSTLRLYWRTLIDKEEAIMKHRHEYETVYRPGVSSEVGALGIKAAELRKCKTCDKEMTFVRIGDEWVPLFEEKEAGEQDILLA
jgi:hypothetical protein